MTPATQAYLALTASDAALHASAIATLRTCVGAITDLAAHAGAKGHSLFSVQCDETADAVTALLYEGQDKQKSVQRLAAEWQERSIALLRVLQESASFDQRLAAAAAPAAPQPPVAP